MLVCLIAEPARNKWEVLEHEVISGHLVGKLKTSYAVTSSNVLNIEYSTIYSTPSSNHFFKLFITSDPIPLHKLLMY